MKHLPEKGQSQLPLDLSQPASSAREDIIESPSNAIAVAMIDAWPDWPGSATLLIGPEGSGKTHLASVWKDNSDAIICEVGDLFEREQELLEQTGQGRTLLLENMPDGKINENALFHLLNLVRQSGSYCLITSRFTADEWNIDLPDLASRLKAAQLIELYEPDDLLLEQVMVKLFADRQLQIDVRVVEYCILRMERSLKTAARLVDTIDALALARKSTISRKIAALALENLGMG